MIPSPPMNISAARTACPNPLQYSPLGTTTNPVTQTADVAVNSALTKDAPPASTLANGVINKAVPRMMRVAKPIVSDRNADVEAGRFSLRRGSWTRMRTGAVSRCRGRLTTRSPGRKCWPLLLNERSWGLG